MKLNDAKDIKLGTTQVLKVFLCEELIWPPQRSSEDDNLDDSHFKEHFQKLVAIQGDRGTNIAIGYIPKHNSRIVMDCMVLDDGKQVIPYAILFGSMAYGADAWALQQFAYPEQQNQTYKLGLCTGNAIRLTDPQYAWADSNLHLGERFTMTAYGNTAQISYQDGDSLTLTNENYSLTDLKYPLCILGSYNKESPTGYAGPVQLYAAQIYEDDKLLYDFIPAFHKEQQLAGLYDKLSKTFYSNSAPNPDYRIIPIYEETEA